MASYTNWFVRNTLDVSSLNGVEPNAQPPIANNICKSGSYKYMDQDMLIIQTSSKSSNVAATSSQLTSLASLPLDIPSNSSRMAPIKGYLTWPPHTSPLKSSISMVHTIAPPNPFALIQFIFERMERSSSKPTH
ncbi:hypothetical protein GQX74_002905 [Glossina fuscipes]|uniref:Uncharacterized protein n=1 Tax=Glossina palpalis gambiensis TaxID=67801 RepID=A0A1B0B9G7_9MUSC|nr:hypothetical protein GQX74_002905 [Glossina fuscipes]